MGFVGCIPRFLKTHAGWVLTALGSLGLIGTVVLTAEEAPEAERRLDDAYVQKVDDINAQYRRENDIPTGTSASYVLPDEWWDKVELTFWEKTKAVLPAYIPAIVVGTGTLACFWGSQIFNARKQAALVAAYGTLVMQFNQYREAIKAEYGEEADKKAYAVSQMEVKRLRKEIEKLKEENGPYRYEFVTLPGVIFDTTPRQLAGAFMHFNRNMTMRGYGDLGELYQMAGIPESAYNREEASKYGWAEYESKVEFGFAYTDFDILQVKNRFGKDVRLIVPLVPPFELEVDYGFEGSVEDHLYPGYNPDAARAFAEELGDDEDIVIDREWCCYAPGVDPI